MRIIKRNHLGEQVWDYKGDLIERTDCAVLFKAHFNRNDLLFNGVLLREGDCFLELYPFRRWFNIYEIHDKDDDGVKGWYCNITRPVVVKGKSISYDDLALDLLVYPDRKMLVLDEDEFESLHLVSGDISNARKGLKQLQSIFSKEEPFSMSNYRKFL